MRSFSTALIVLLCVSGLAAAQSGEPSLSTWLQKSRIYQGESVRYSIEVKNVENPAEPDLSAFDVFQIEFLGRSQNSASFTMIINGRRVTEDNLGFTYNYALTPKESGDLIVPSPTLAVSGVRLSGERHRLTVIQPEKQDLVIFDLDVERVGSYPLQPLTVGLRIFVQKLPRPYRDHDPLTYLSIPPQLRIPWVDVPEGLAADDLSNWLAPLRARSQGRSQAYGFTINDLTFQPNSLFGRPRTGLFDLGGRAATADDVAGIERLAGKADDYYVYTLRRKFVPLWAGKFLFGATTIKGGIIVDVQGNNPITRDIFDVGGSAVIEVKDAPAEGRPPSFSGAFGSRFAVTADVQPRRARVGDPLTLTVTLAGVGNLGVVDPPDLAAEESFSTRFRVEKPTVDREGERPVFTYSLRPLSAGVNEVPPVPFSYFDLDRERYVTVHSEALPLLVEEIESLGGGDIVRGLNGRGAGSVSLTRAEGLFGNITDPREIEDESVDLRLFGGYLGGLLALYAILGGLVTRHRRLHGDPARIRRRTAAGRARGRLERALLALKAGDGEGAALGLRSAFVGLVADVCGLPEAGLTVREVESRLVGLGVAAEQVDHVAGLMMTCDGLRYGGTEAVAGEESARVLDDLIASLRATGRLR